MLHRWRIAAAVVALFLWVGVRPFAADNVTGSLPSRLSDRAFWRLVNEFSEPGGFFRSDNFLSNETAFQTVIPDLVASVPAGGAYVGVGPEQNFTYIVALRPTLAFVVDIRRQNMLEHLLYKAFIELSANRADFLSRLFARKRPADLPASATIEALFAAYATVTPSEELFRTNLQAARNRLVGDHKFALSEDDLRSLEYVYSAFYRGGPDLNYAFSPTGVVSGFGGGFPTYRELMLETDGQGEQRSYLAAEEGYRLLREYQRNNAIVPVVGDFGGDHALRAIGEYVRAHNASLTVFYTSNVEQYLFQEAYAWRKFLVNVATFPLGPRSTLIRSISNRGFPFSQFRKLSPGARASTALSSMPELVRAFNAGQIHQYTDIVAMSK